MRQNVYFDSKRKVFLSERDGIKLEKIDNSPNEYTFLLHKLGFPIFLSKTELGEIDEYEQNDPYTVEDNIHTKFHQRRISLTLELMKKVATPESVILDIGCGQGHITHTFINIVPNDNIYGFDRSLNAIIVAKRTYPEIEFAVADVHNPPYPPNYFDIVVCNNLWEHIPDPLFTLKIIRIILKGNGFLIISTPSRYRLENLIKVMRGKPIAFMSDHHVTEYSVGQIIEHLKFGKFDIIEIKSYPIREKSDGLKSFVVYKLIKPMLQWYLRKLSSHHCLESTVFFLAKKYE